jgi:hypothetical protein
LRGSHPQAQKLDGNLLIGGGSVDLRGSFLVISGKGWGRSHSQQKSSEGECNQGFHVGSVVKGVKLDLTLGLSA